MVNKKQFSKSEIFALACGIVSGLTGLVVILGWQIHSQSLIQILPVFAPMQFNTALCFLIIATALISHVLNWSLFSKIAVSILLFFAFATAVEYVFSISIGIDQLFVNTPSEQAKTLVSGRMSPPTTISFLLLGLAILMMNFKSVFKNASFVVGLVCSIAFSLALSTLIGYILKFETVSGYTQLLGMALHTASGFLLVSIAIFSLAVTNKARAKGTFPRWIGAPVAVVVFCIAVVMWQALLTQEYQNLKGYMQLQTVSLKQILDEKLTLHFNTLQRMAFRLETIKGMSREEWKNDVSLFLTHFESYQAIVHVDKDLKIADQVVEKNVKAPSQLISVSELKNLKAKSRRDSQFVYTRSPKAEDKSELFLIVPLFSTSEFDGFVGAALDAGKFLDFGYTIEHQVDYSIKLAVDNSTFELFGNCCPDLNSGLVTELSFNDPRGQWTISSWPSNELIDQYSTYLPQVVLFGGMALALLSFLMIHFGVTAQYRSLELVEVNESLEKKVVERTKELKERDEFTRQWLSNCTDGAWYWDLEKNKVFMTHQFKTLLGYTDEEIDDSVDNWRKLVPPMDLQVADKAYQEYMNFGKSYSYQLRWMHKNGTMVWTLCRGEGIKDESGKIIHMVGTLTDISKLKQMEEELTRWAEELERKNSDLERFNRLAVGREKRMIELKSKVNQLHKELGKPEPYKLDFKNQPDTVGVTDGE